MHSVFEFAKMSSHCPLINILVVHEKLFFHSTLHYLYDLCRLLTVPHYALYCTKTAEILSRMLNTITRTIISIN